MGIVSIDTLPFEIKEQMVRNDLKIPDYRWNEMDVEDKGKMIATSIIEDRIQFIQRYYSQERTEKERVKPKKTNATSKSSHQ